MNVTIEASKLQDAITELQNLRRQNEILGAKVETMELCAALLFGGPASRGFGHSPDVAYPLQVAIDEAKAARATPTPRAVPPAPPSVS